MALIHPPGSSEQRLPQSSIMISDAAIASETLSAILSCALRPPDWQR
ncbi:MAG: hypothetical protein WBA10_05515 [Elainellaceae cyanobacterium]